MNKQISTLFDKFYTIILKDQIQDPLIHSEWVYFQSMITNDTFQRDRISMYLNILENEKKKKNLLHHQRQSFDISDLKLEKRHSEPVKPDILKIKEYSLNKGRGENKSNDGEQKETWRKNENKINYRRLLEAANGLISVMESTALKAI